MPPYVLGATLMSAENILLDVPFSSVDACGQLQYGRPTLGILCGVHAALMPRVPPDIYIVPQVHVLCDLVWLTFAQPFRQALFSMQLFKVIWTFVITIADYPSRLGSQLSSVYSYDKAPAALKEQFTLPPNNNDQGCVNSPQRRDCWHDGYNIHTDYEKSVPYTGVTRKVSI